MEITISELAKFVNGKVIGNSKEKITGIAKISEASSGELSFLYNPLYKKHLQTTKASAVIINPNIEKTNNNISYIEVEKPEKAFYKVLLEFFSPEFILKGIDKTSSISDTVLLGKNVSVGKNVIIEGNCEIGKGTKIFHNTVVMGNVKIGNNVLIFPNVTIRENTVIGNNVIIHSGTVLGSDGFGYNTDLEGIYHKIPQIGNVVIEDDVELGSNVSIDRAALGSTIIKKGAKIDNLVQVAHNCSVGNNTAISAQTGISGSVNIGNNCIIAGQVGFAGHIDICDNVMIGAQSGVSKTINKEGKYFGYPAKEMSMALKQEAYIRNLKNYSEKIKELEQRIKKLEKNGNEKNGNEKNGNEK